MNVNLYPYNYWILYAAIGLTLICIIALLMKLLKTAKTLKAMTPQLEHMNQQLKLASIKAEAVSEKSEADMKRIKPLLTALPILLAINSIYNKDDELEGIKGYGTAARKYVEKKSSEQQLAKAVSKILRK